MTAIVSAAFVLVFVVAGQVRAEGLAPEKILRRPAVAAPNLSVTSLYRFSKFERTDTRISLPDRIIGIRIGDFESHVVAGGLKVTMPITHSTGVRLRVGGEYYHQRSSLDLFGPGSESFSTESYGAGVDVFLRDPDLGAVTAGVALSHTDLGDTDDANQIDGRLSAEFFFPDLDAGPITWSTSLFYKRVNFSGPGATSEIDLDFFGVRVGTDWYITETAALNVSVGWARSEDSFDSYEDTDGTLGLSGLLGRSSLVSAEISGSATFGSREVKIFAFPEDRKFFYRMMLGISLRLNSGRSLVEIARAYD